jgi:toxin ParE1/3/4
MSRFVLDPAVTADLDSIWDYVGVQNFAPQAAHRLIERLFDCFVYLSDHPLSGEARPDLSEGIRGFVVRPYLVLYRVREEDIQIVRVVHGARDIYAIFGSQMTDDG